LNSRLKIRRFLLDISSPFENLSLISLSHFWGALQRMEPCISVWSRLGKKGS
jgi:hypothetical protein